MLAYQFPVGVGPYYIPHGGTERSALCAFEEGACRWLESTGALVCRAEANEEEWSGTPGRGDDLGKQSERMVMCELSFPLMSVSRKLGVTTVAKVRSKFGLVGADVRQTVMCALLFSWSNAATRGKEFSDEVRADHSA